MVEQFDLYFAGLARDTSGTLKENVGKVLDICEHKSVREGKIFIAENGSQDDTREILKELEKTNPQIELHLFNNLDEDFPIREERIAFLREYLFDNICDYSNGLRPGYPQLYIPIDLDSTIAQSIDGSIFIDECEYVARDNVSAVFPASRPRYYDIYALRADGWIETDCWERVHKLRDMVWPFLPTIKYVYSNQKRLDELQDVDRISVDSAFGGVGIYNLERITNATYKQNDSLPNTTCEHVIFNSHINSKEISTQFVVDAPQEHIQYHTSLINKMCIIFNLILINIYHALKPTVLK